MKRRSGDLKPEPGKDAGTRLPKLRQLEPIPVETHGERWIALADPAGWVERPFEIPPAFAFLLQFLDGKHTMRDVQKAYSEATGEFLFLSNIEKLVDQLDEAYLLDTPRFAAYRKELAEGFRAASVRPPAGAGKGYPAEPKRLAALLDRLMDEAPSPAGAKQAGEVRGIVAPHMPVTKGGGVYAAAWRAAKPLRDVDVAVVLGTYHAGLASGFALTRKDHETPLGTVAVDQELVDAVADAVPTALDEDFAHRAETTIEHQAVFLAHLFGKRKNPPMLLPVLCGFGAGDAQASEQRRIILDFLAALGAAVEKSGKKALWIASADLSHVGPRFGDERGMSPSALARVATTDREVLAPALAGDAEGFLAAITRVQEEHRICGFPVIYGLVRLLGGAAGKGGMSGTLLDYGQAEADDLGSFITCAAASFAKGK